MFLPMRDILGDKRTYSPTLINDFQLLYFSMYIRTYMRKVSISRIKYSPAIGKTVTTNGYKTSNVGIVTYDKNFGT